MSAGPIDAPGCDECIELGVAITSARAMGDTVGVRLMQEEIDEHLDTAHSAQ
ncbi:hypothetical protein ACQEVX_30240 [Streptomyces syringium]|uniref:hypothetical protein n=1 Tax=Streptomyces syringium TaxID=76729 RepID=UPI003D8C6E3D